MNTSRRTGIAIAVFAVIGLVLLLVVRAANDNVSVDSSEFSVTSPASTRTDSSASNNSFTEFSDPEFGFSTWPNNTSLANEVNIASNGDWTWPTEIQRNGADRYVFRIVPMDATNSNYFWASVFRWSNRSTGGYIGLQTRVYPLSQAKGAIFSIWDTTVGERVDDGIVQPFGGEGTGIQTARRLNWRLSTQYDVIVEKDHARSTSAYNWWRGFAVESSSQGGIEIGRIRTPASWGHPIPHNTFLERYGAINTCREIPTARGDFLNPEARYNGQTYTASAVRVEIRRYSDCSGVITALKRANGYRVGIQSGTN